MLIVSEYLEKFVSWLFETCSIRAVHDINKPLKNKNEILFLIYFLKFDDTYFFQ